MSALIAPRRLQSVLPRATVHHVRREIWSKLLARIQAGYWFCHGCEGPTEREEGEQGQPAHCSKCGSHRIEWNRPALSND